MEAPNKIIIFPYSLAGENFESVWLMNYESGAGETCAAATVDTDTDTDMLSASVGFLKSQGFDVSDPDRWHYLGIKTVRGDGQDPAAVLYGYSVDVTGVDRDHSEFDQSLAPRGLHEALTSADCATVAFFVRMFQFVFNFKDYSIIKKKNV